MAWGLPDPKTKKSTSSAAPEQAWEALASLTEGGNTGSDSHMATGAAAEAVLALKAAAKEAEEESKVNLYDSFEKVEEITLDGLVVLQILKHVQDQASLGASGNNSTSLNSGHNNYRNNSENKTPVGVSGCLLGMENDKVLEITHSFPNPSNSYATKDVTAAANDAFQSEMLKNFQQVNVDHNKVGWYQSTIGGVFCTKEILEYQFAHQQMFGPNSICLMYDPNMTMNGTLALKAFRLSSAFVEEFKQGDFTRESFAKANIRTDNMFEEIPIRIHNTDLITCWLIENAKSSSGAATTTTTSSSANKEKNFDCDFDRLDLSTNAFLENSLTNLSSWSDELAQENYRFQGYERAVTKQRQQHLQWVHRRKEENKQRRDKGMDLLPEEDTTTLKSFSPPSRLESLLITKQMTTYCDQINQFTGKSLQKLFLFGSLHKES